MAQYILTSKATVVPRRTVKRIPTEQLATDQLKRHMKIFDSVIYAKLGDLLTSREVKEEDLKWTPYKDDEETPRSFPDDDEFPFDFFNVSLTDGLINSEVLVHQGENMDWGKGPKVKAKVVGHLTDTNGDIIGQHNEDPSKNTVMYEVEFADGTRKPYTANIIAQ